MRVPLPCHQQLPAPALLLLLLWEPAPRMHLYPGYRLPLGLDSFKSLVEGGDQVPSGWEYVISVDSGEDG